MNVFRVGFIVPNCMEYKLAGKNLLQYTNLFSPNDYQKNDKIIYKYFFGINMSSLEFRFTKIDETINYLLEEIKHNDLISEKYKKTCKYLNYVEDLLILVSAAKYLKYVENFLILVSTATNCTLCNHCRNKKVLVNYKENVIHA